MRSDRKSFFLPPRHQSLIVPSVQSKHFEEADSPLKRENPEVYKRVVDWILASQGMWRFTRPLNSLSDSPIRIIWNEQSDI